MKLTVQNITFSYPGVPVFDRISLKIMPGETVVVVGENGAGKSTLIKCMNRILKYQYGTVLLDERDIMEMTRKDIALHMAYLPQKTSYLYPVTVFDAILAGRYPYLGTERRTAGEERVWNILKIMGLENIAMRDFHEISGGQQQQVIIARALAQEADILLLDEPTSGLDIRHQLEVMDVISRSVSQHGVSAVISMHDLNIAARYADRVIMLHGGDIYAAGEPRTVLTAEHIAEVYRVEAEVTEREGRPVINPLRPL